MKTQRKGAVVNPSTPKTELHPSTGLRKAIVGGPLMLKDVIEFPVLSDAQMDPTCKTIAYVRSDLTREDTKLPKQHIWLVDANGRNERQLSNGPRADSHPRWSPDGRQMAFLSDRKEDGKLQVYLIDRGGGEAIQLAEMAGGVDTSRWKDALQWSPDGKFLAFLAKDGERKEEKKRKEEKDDADEFEAVHKYVRLWTLEVATRQLRLVTRSNTQVWEFAYSPDGREFALIVSDLPYEWSWYRNWLVCVSVRGGKMTTVLRPEKRQIALPRWSPDGKRIAFLSSLWCDRGVIQGDVFLVDARGGTARDITPSHAGSIGWMEWTKQGRSLLAIGYERGYAALTKLDPHHRRVKTLWRKPMAISEAVWPRFSLAKNQQSLTLVLCSPADNWNVWLGQLGGKHLNFRRLTDAAPQQREFLLGRQEMIHWTSRDGRRLQGILLKPVGYRSGRRYPLIVNPHGGPTGIVANGFMAASLWGQLLATNGYAVFYPNFRGSTGFGLQFAEANLGDMGGMDFQDIETGVDTLIERGIADPRRLGVGGWSYGGFMTCWMITQTNRYKVAVMGAGISNWLSFHGNSHLHAWDAILAQANPYERDGIYAKFSAMNYVNRVKTPTLILHGEQDRDVPPEQSYQFYRALRDHAIATELVIYPREDHGINEKRHWMDLHRRVAAWYHRYLK